LGVQREDFHPEMKESGLKKCEIRMKKKGLENEARQNENWK
jgi:hypothetical protein